MTFDLMNATASLVRASSKLIIYGLDEGAAVSYDVAADFAVLCSNCHRMIHRATDPSDLQGFRRLIRLPQAR